MRSAMADRSWQGWQALPVHAVGAIDRSRRARRRASRSKRSAPAMSSDLLAALPASLRLLHLAGEDHREGADGTDRPPRSSIAPTSIADPGLPPLDGLVVAVHSPRAGTRLAELAGERARTAIAAISDAAAEACGDGWERDRSCRPSPTTRACWPSPPALCHTSPPNDRWPISTRLVLDRALRLGAAAAARRRGAGDLGPVALGCGRALFRGRARANRCRSSASQPLPVQPPPNAAEPLAAADAARIATLESRLARDRRPGRRPPPDRPGGPTPCWSPSPRAARSIAGSRSAISSRLLVQRFGRTAPGRRRDDRHRVARSGPPRQPGRRISGAGPDAARRRAGRRLVGRVPARAGNDRVDPSRRYTVAAAAGALRPCAGAARGRRGRCGAGGNDAPAGMPPTPTSGSSGPAATSRPTARSTKSNPRPCSASRRIADFARHRRAERAWQDRRDLRVCDPQALVQQQAD